jgi:hypothetical protein
MAVAVFLVVAVLASIALALAHARATRPADAQQISTAQGVVDSPIELKARKSKTKSNPSADTVYITETGTKYHRAGCRSLRKSKIAISRADAIKQGYAACKICSP